MAEILAIIGGVAGGIQMADAFSKLASELRHFIRTVRYAPQQIHLFRLDLSNFSASLRMFVELSEKGLKYLTKLRERKQREKYIAGVIQECEVVKQGFKQLLRRFFKDVINFPSLHGYLDRVRWYLGRTSIAGLKMSLESAKSSISLFLSLHHVECLHREIERLSRKSQEVPQDLVDALYYNQATKPDPANSVSRHKMNRQLKEQKRARKAAHQLLFKHFSANVHSNQATLVEDIRPILQETYSIQRSTTKTLQKESERILRRSSPTSTSQYSDNRSPSSSPGPTAQDPQGPRIIPPAPGYTSISRENTPSPTPRRRARKSTAGVLSPNAGNSASVLQTTEHVDFPQEISPLRGTSPSAISSVRSRSPPIFGPIIRDDGTRITETHGQWRRSEDAKTFLSESSDPNQNLCDIELSASSLHANGEEEDVEEKGGAGEEQGEEQRGADERGGEKQKEEEKGEVRTEVTQQKQDSSG